MHVSNLSTDQLKFLFAQFDKLSIQPIMRVIIIIIAADSVGPRKPPSLVIVDSDHLQSSLMFAVCMYDLLNL